MHGSTGGSEVQPSASGFSKHGSTSGSGPGTIPGSGLGSGSGSGSGSSPPPPPSPLSPPPLSPPPPVSPPYSSEVAEAKSKLKTGVSKLPNIPTIITKNAMLL
jgi:hypothetical protein